jgi:O-antigen ligase
VPNAHDTYLDEYISTGVLGTPLYMFIFWGGLFVAWRRYIKVPIAEHLFPAVMLSWLFFTSWVEAIPLDPFLPTTLAYVCMLKSMLPAQQPVIAQAKPTPPNLRRQQPALGQSSRVISG